MRANPAEIQQTAYLFDLDFLAGRTGLFAFVAVGLVGFLIHRRDEARLSRERLRYDNPVVRMIALHEPVARRAGAARLAVGLLRLAQQALRQMLGKAQLADSRLTMEQQRMRPVAAQLLQAIPVIGLPRINHRFSFRFNRLSAIYQVRSELPIRYDCALYFFKIKAFRSDLQVFSESAECSVKSQ